MISQLQPERINRNHPELGWGDDAITEGMVCAYSPEVGSVLGGSEISVLNIPIKLEWAGDKVGNTGKGQVCREVQDGQGVTALS